MAGGVTKENTDPLYIVPCENPGHCDAPKCKCTRWLCSASATEDELLKPPTDDEVKTVFRAFWGYDLHDNYAAMKYALNKFIELRSKKS